MTTRSPLLAVIGTAGRQDDAAKINRPLYDAMYAETLRAMADWNVTGLISGGAAMADHLAVRAFLDGKADRLVLHLPAAFQNGQYATAGDGATANRYHRDFSRMCGLNSLDEMARAMAKPGCESHVGRGFKARNLDVASAATHMLAMTFGAMQEPEDLLPDHPDFGDPDMAGLKRRSGTGHTFAQAWRCDIKRHVSLNWLIAHPERQTRMSDEGGGGVLLRR